MAGPVPFSSIRVVKESFARGSLFVKYCIAIQHFKGRRMCHESSHFCRYSARVADTR